MGHAIPRQQPAVVLRSQFGQLRGWLAIALISVASLTVAVDILANDNDQAASTSSAKPIESINYGDSNYLNPSTGGDSRYLNPSTGGDSRYLNPSTGGSRYLNPSTGAAAVGQSNDGTVTRGSKTDPHGPASLLR
jgi:hypothetical protein